MQDQIFYISFLICDLQNTFINIFISKPISILTFHPQRVSLTRRIPIDMTLPLDFLFFFISNTAAEFFTAATQIVLTSGASVLMVVVISVMFASLILIQKFYLR